jgi:hypothetical protein
MDLGKDGKVADSHRSPDDSPISVFPISTRPISETIIDSFRKPAGGKPGQLSPAASSCIAVNTEDSREIAPRRKKLSGVSTNPPERSPNEFPQRLEDPWKETIAAFLLRN